MFLPSLEVSPPPPTHTHTYTHNPQNQVFEWFKRGIRQNQWGYLKFGESYQD